MTRCDEETGRCECCGCVVPYLTLKMVKLELPVRRVRGMVVVERQTIYRRECTECREEQ